MRLPDLAVLDAGTNRVDILQVGDGQGGVLQPLACHRFSPAWTLWRW